MKRKIRVVIDPGHGGKDRWNRGPTKYIEADGVLKISKYLKELLEKTGYFEVKLTRETDKNLTLRERAVIGRDFNTDLLISQHTNAFNGTARGSEVFYSVKRPKDQQTAAKIAKGIADAFKTVNRGAKTRKNDRGNDFYGILRESVNLGIPSVLLVESLFHDHPKEESYLLKDENLKLIAEIQCQAILDHFSLKAAPVKIEDHPSEKSESVVVDPEEKLYRVQTGAFSVRKNALRQEKNLLNHGFDTFLFNDGSLYKVQVGAYRVKSNAEKMVKRLQEAGFQTYLVHY